MGWQRRNKSWYYYHTITINGRDVNLYCGGGERGRQAEAMFARIADGRRLVSATKLAARKSKRCPREAVGATSGAQAV